VRDNLKVLAVVWTVPPPLPGDGAIPLIAVPAALPGGTPPPTVVPPAPVVILLEAAGVLGPLDVEHEPAEVGVVEILLGGLGILVVLVLDEGELFLGWGGVYSEVDLAPAKGFEGLLELAGCHPLRDVPDEQAHLYEKPIYITTGMNGQYADAALSGFLLLYSAAIRKRTTAWTMTEDSRWSCWAFWRSVGRGIGA
jgi:hypothetical protein